MDWEKPRLDYVSLSMLSLTHVIRIPPCIYV